MKTPLILLLLLMLVAGCGGTTEPPTATPRPTLTVEERVTFTAGTIENPLLMVLRPVPEIEARVRQALAAEAGVRLDEIESEQSIRDDLNIEFVRVNEAARRDFNVELGDVADEITTPADLVTAIHQHLGARVSETLFDRTGLYIEVVAVSTHGQALEALCDSGSGLVAIPWLDGLTYAAAEARNCGQPGLQVAAELPRIDPFPPLAVVDAEATAELITEAASDITPEVTAEVTAESTPEVTVAPTRTVEATEAPTAVSPADIEPGELRTGMPGVVVADGAFSGGSIFVVQERTFCHLGVDDFYSWLVPTLIMEANNLDPLRAVSTHREYDDLDALLAAVSSGECTATGMDQFTYESLDSAGTTVVETTVPFPLGVLTYPLEVGLGTRLTLNEQLPALLEDEEDGAALRLLLGADLLLPAEPADFDALNEFLDRTGLDFGALDS